MVQEAKPGPKVVHRAHPRGAKGTKISVNEVVRRATEGRKDPKTIAWARETVVKGGLAGFGADKMAQAKAVLERLRRERGYIEDPVDAEAMVSSACLLDGCEGLTFLGEDCDGLVVGFLSAVEAIGIEGAVVAHSYEPHLQHTHVLAAVYDRDRKRWVRCDPSTSDPFGTASKPTRETFYLVPGGKVIGDTKGPCDVAKMTAVYENLRPQGDFVGVGRPGGGQVGEEPKKAEPVFPEVSEAFYGYMVQETARSTDELAQTWEQVLIRHREYELVCEMLGYSLLDADWTEQDEARFQAYKQWIPLFLNYGYDVVSGRRKVAWDPVTEKTVILGTPGELAVNVNEAGAIQIIDTKTGKTVGTVGGGALLVVAIVVISLAAVGIVYGSAKILQTKAENAKDKRNHEADVAAVEAGVPPVQVQKDRMERERLANERAVAEVEKEKVNPFAQVAKTAESITTALGWVAVAGASVYALSIAADWLSRRKPARAT